MRMKIKITFEEIQPGDSIEVVDETDGVKTVQTGTAHEHEGEWISSYGAWYTEEGGLLVIEDERQDIYRVEQAAIKFADLREGDRIRVSFPPIQHSMSRHGDITYERSGEVGYIMEGYGEALTPSGERLASRSDFFEGAQVEILDRVG